MSYATIDALRESLAQAAPKQRSPEYVAKMMHAIPAATVVDRTAFIVERCRGKAIVEFGASGSLTPKIIAVAKAYVGYDRVTVDASDIHGIDLDDCSIDHFPGSIQADLIVCGEVLEHLANPGHFLETLRLNWPGVPVLISTPNAFCQAASVHMQAGLENVNLDHVCWYSATTLRTLLTRYGFTIEAFHWYNGDPLTAEGMIVVAR